MVADRERKRSILSHLLRRAGLSEDWFWKLARGRRGRLFLSRYSRVSREIPQLEITSFDLDKLLKERYRQEPLTLGAAWHYGFWRSYFSHAAITHPANDGLREEFSTAWDLVRKHPAVLFRTAVRATGQGFSFNFGRILAAIGALQAGNLVGFFKSDITLLGQTYKACPIACSLMALVYLVGLVVIAFAPETKGRPLPD